MLPALIFGSLSEKLHKMIFIKSGSQAKMVNENLYIISIKILFKSFKKKYIFKTMASQMPSPYSNCVLNEEINTNLSQEMIKHNMAYSRENCFVFCK